MEGHSDFEPSQMQRRLSNSSDLISFEDNTPGTHAHPSRTTTAREAQPFDARDFAEAPASTNATISADARAHAYACLITGENVAAEPQSSTQPFDFPRKDGHPPRRTSISWSEQARPTELVQPKPSDLLQTVEDNSPQNDVYNNPMDTSLDGVAHKRAGVHEKNDSGYDPDYQILPRMDFLDHRPLITRDGPIDELNSNYARASAVFDEGAAQLTDLAFEALEQTIEATTPPPPVPARDAMRRGMVIDGNSLLATRLSMASLATLSDRSDVTEIPVERDADADAAAGARWHEPISTKHITSAMRPPTPVGHTYTQSAREPTFIEGPNGRLRLSPAALAQVRAKAIRMGNGMVAPPMVDRPRGRVDREQIENGDEVLGLMPSLKRLRERPVIKLGKSKEMRRFEAELMVERRGEMEGQAADVVPNRSDETNEMDDISSAKSDNNTEKPDPEIDEGKRFTTDLADRVAASEASLTTVINETQQQSQPPPSEVTEPPRTPPRPSTSSSQRTVWPRLSLHSSNSGETTAIRTSTDTSSKLKAVKSTLLSPFTSPALSPLTSISHLPNLPNIPNLFSPRPRAPSTEEEKARQRALQLGDVQAASARLQNVMGMSGQVGAYFTDTAITSPRKSIGGGGETSRPSTNSENVSGDKGEGEAGSRPSTGNRKDGDVKWGWMDGGWNTTKQLPRPSSSSKDVPPRAEEVQRGGQEAISTGKDTPSTARDTLSTTEAPPTTSQPQQTGDWGRLNAPFDIDGRFWEGEDAKEGQEGSKSGEDRGSMDWKKGLNGLKGVLKGRGLKRNRDEKAGASEGNAGYDSWNGGFV